MFNWWVTFGNNQFLKSLDCAQAFVRVNSLVAWIDGRAKVNIEWFLKNEKGAPPISSIICYNNSSM